MKNMAKICSVLRCAFRVSLFASAATFLLFSPVHADDDPFQLDSAHWMSFDHYKDADTRGILPKAAQKIETPAAAPEAEQSTAGVTPSQEQTSLATQVAAPTRPIDLPVMPGMNKGFKMQVTTTEDDHIAAAPVIEENAPSDIHLTDKNWQSPSSIVSNKSEADDDDGAQHLNVRLSYLPDSKIAPVPSPEHETAEHKMRVAMEKGLANQQQKVASEDKKQPAVCAAIDAYKKQQLNAIQSDRETLKALQDAIASLGLQKQLGFMTSSASALNGQSAPPANIDMPAPTTVQ